MAPRAKAAPAEMDLRPYAPRRLIGQERAWGQISDHFSLGRSPSGLIFHGPAGVGKRTAAVLLAKTLLGGGLPQHDSYSLDDAFVPAARIVEQAGHPDLLLLEKLADKTELTVAVIRRIGKLFEKTGAFSSRRIVIIDGAEHMNREAANALLKKLEEPPQGGLIILIARSLGSLLPTVLSRCAKVPFAPLSPDDFAQWAESEGQPELAGLGEAAGFAPGQALGLSDGKVLGWLEQLASLGQEFHPARHAAQAAQLARDVGKNGDRAFRAPFLRALRARASAHQALPETRKDQSLYRDALGAFGKIDGLNLNAEDEWRALLQRF